MFMIVGQEAKADKSEVGGKAYGLFQLRSAGLRVPNFLVLPISLFEKFIRTKDNGEDLTLDPSFQILDDDKISMLNILKSWGFPIQAVVVRSSVQDEDGNTNSFPGMMDSFLNIASEPSLHQAIYDCAQSAFSARSKEYRKQKGLTHYAKPAVIIQMQVAATSSGILFTTSPDFPQEIAIHAVHGFSVELNLGQVNPHEYYLWKSTGNLNREVSEAKDISASLEEAGEDQGALSSTQLQQLFVASKQIENFFQHPQDVEFVFEGHELFIVQARPVTQPIPEVVVFDNSNIQESYCGVTTPLTFSFACRAYATVYRQTMRALGLSNRTITKNEKIVQNLLGLVKGRIYYNINNWYRGLQMLPSFKQNKSDMERMMGLTEPVEFVKDRELSFWAKCVKAPSLIANLLRLLFAFQRLDSSIEKFLRNNNVFQAEFYKTDLTKLKLSDLVSLKEKLDNNLLNEWTTPIVNDFYVMMTNGASIRTLKKSGLENPEEFLSLFLSGNNQLASLQPTIALQALAEFVKAEKDLQSLVQAVPSNVDELVKSKFPDFHKRARAFINAFGDRTIGELKLETITMRIDPIVFYKYLGNMLGTSVKGLGHGQLREQAVRELNARLSFQSSWFRWRARRKLKKLERAIGNREAMRLERTRLFGMYRSVYLAMANYYLNENILESARDIFYLSESEILNMQNENAGAIKEKIKSRKSEFESYKKETVPSRIMVPYPPVARQVQEVDTNIISGTGCYPGMAEGEAIVVADPEQDINCQDKIICAIRTDPGWASLFPSCKGVLIEKGSSLSHSVILLRELGIPTIINIPNLTLRIKTGDLVSMNGSTGKIELTQHTHA
jgi:rifampicin phosphotransferase